MASWLDVAVVVVGAFFLIHGAASLALGRSVIPRPFGRPNPARWELSAQIIYGIVLLLREASFSFGSSLRGLAAFAAVIGSGALLGVSLRATSPHGAG
jgi:hypothetical protein